MSMVENLREHLASPEGKASMEKYFQKIADKEALDEKRYRRFETWLETNDFDKLMYRLLFEHGDEYIEKLMIQRSRDKKLQKLLN